MRADLFLVFVIAGFAPACGSSGGDSGDPSSSSLGGAGAGTGGAPATGGAAGTSGTPAMGGAAGTGGNVPAGQLTCSGRLCQKGGNCTMAGLCPAFLGDCFTRTAGFDACSDYCASKGLGCAEKACNYDGTSFDPPRAFTWVAYTASHSAECASAGAPDLNGPDSCATPIWLSASMPSDSVVRCCCQ